MSALLDQLGDLTPEQRELLALLLEEQGIGDAEMAPAEQTIAPRKQLGENAPLSFAQQRLWFLDQLEPGSPMYNMPAAARLHGLLSVPTLQDALDEIVARHEVLRTIFVRREDGEPVQEILPPRHVTVTVIDLAAQPAPVQEQEIVRLATQEVQSPFDLANGPLLRVMLLVLGERDYLLLLNMHHIVADGWSIGVFIRELGQLYAAFAAGRPSPLPSLPLQYGDYALWQREVLRGEALENQLAYWREALSNAPAAIDLPFDRPRPAVQTFRGAVVEFTIPGRVQKSVAQLAQREGATLFMVLLSAFQVLLSRYARQADVCVGTPVANRVRTELEALIGFFTNTVVIRGQIDGDKSFREFVQQIREVTLGAFDHQDVPFEQVVEAVQPERTLSYSPVFQVMFVLQNVPKGTVQMPGVSLSPVTFPSVTAKFDLTLNLSEQPDGISGLIEYNTDLLERATVERMIRNFEVLLEAAVERPDEKVSRLPLLSDAERALILHAWNETSVPFPSDTTIHALIAEAAECWPQATAVEFVELAGESIRTSSLTYQALHERAYQLAWHLRGLGVGPDTLVGLSVERSLDMVVGILGILNAGGAYLPLDPGYPADRLTFMIADSGIKILVTHASIAQHLPLTADGVPDDLHVIRLDEDWSEIAVHPTTDPCIALGPENLAYSIYTSGSTGRPKAVLIRHRGVCSLADAAARDLDMGPGKRVLQFAAFSFDASVWETVMALRHGAVLVLAPKQTLASGPDLLRLLRQASITTVILPPSLLAVLDPVELPHLETLLTGGERCTNQMVQRWAAAGRTFINAYGPTEITVCATMHRCDPSVEWPFGGPPIGRPIANTQCYVVDENLQLLPVGVPGELVIGGVGVAKGYLGRPELTSARFVSKPSGWDGAAAASGLSAAPDVLYHTGDLVRWLPNGEIEFLGRIDDQVKVRGYRIELGEIESVLREHEAIRDAVVAARGNTLVAYYIPIATDARESDSPALTSELRAHLRQRVPEYMVPAIFVPVEAFPRSPAGKLDRRALPAPDQVGLEAQVEFVAPRTPTEDVLASICSHLLNVPVVGANDNFFALGGHSLAATQLVSRIRSALGVELPLRSLFDSPTIAGLAAAVDRLRAEQSGSVAPPIRAVSRIVDADGRVRFQLSFAQQRLWFLDQLEPGGTLYNIPSAVRLVGSLDLPALQQAFDGLAARHESLRTTFETVDGKPVQVIAPSGHLPLHLVDLSAVEADRQEAAVMREAVADARRPFDLAQGPLVRVTVLRLAEAEHVLLFTMHHIIADGWSTGVMMREFGQLYAAFASGGSAELPPQGLQYADYAVWQRAWLSGSGEGPSPLERQLAYWRHALDGAPALLELPTDWPRPAAPSHHGASVAFEFPMELAERVRQISREEGATLFMTLMAAYQALLFRLTAQTDICVGTPVANRSAAELEGIIGFFVNTLVLRADMGDAPSFRGLLHRVRTSALGAYAHQDVPFEKLVDELSVVREAGHSPLFQAMFVWQEQRQNLSSGAVRLPGLALTPVPVHGGTTPFDLTLVMADSGKGLSGWLEYSTELFEAETAARFVRYFETLLRGVLDAPDQPVAQVAMVTPDERQRVLEAWNDTAAPVPDVCLHEAFEQQVRRSPDGTALIFAGDGDGRPPSTLSYAEVDRLADALACTLQQLDVEAEEIIAISVEKSAEQIVGLLGILKAGAAYLPIDPAYPPDRIAYLLADSGARVLLTQSHLADRFTAPGLQNVICLNEFLAAPRGDEGSRPVRRAAPDSLAYVIYTSGSTGQPKGVMVEHRSIVNHAYALMGQTGIGRGDRLLQFVSLSFDAAGEEFYPALLSGATLVLPGDTQALMGAGLPAFCEQYGITLVHMPATAWHGVVDDLVARGAAWHGPLRLLMLGGDAPDPARLAAFMKLLGRDIPFMNLYGPTEATITTTTFRTADFPFRGRLPIGRPIANAAVYVLDGAGQPAPIGVPGEIFIGGAGVARGYLGRPELTAERFIPNPFAGTAAGTRIAGSFTRDLVYRTGDKGRWRADGNLEFLGRADDQVKIRGYRIELGEIEAALAAHSAVRECAVLAHGDAGEGGKRLVAYIVPAGDPPPTTGELRTFLLKTLPDYMAPSIFVRLPSLPLNQHGKVDRNALRIAALPAAASEERTGTGAEFQAPGTPAEQALADIWSQVLGVSEVGVNDNFFELGGDSILSIQVIARANQAGLHLTPKQLFQAPTIAGLAALAGTAPATAVAQGPVEGPVELTPIQRWFFELELADRSHWNQSVLLSVRQRLVPESLGAAVAALVEHHDALRLRFTETECGWQATHAAPDGAAPAPFEHVDLSGLPPEGFSPAVQRLCAEAQKSLHISRGPLIRAVYYDAGADRPSRLLLVIHHLATDGVSWRVLLEDLQSAYAQHTRSGAIELPPKTVSFQTWARALAAFAGSEGVTNEADYWLERTSGWVPPLPTDLEADPALNVEASVAQVGVTLSQEDTEALLTEAGAAYNTETPDLLLTALAQTVEKWTGSPTLFVNLEGHGREELGDPPSGSLDVSRTVGWFTSMYPVRLDLPWGSAEAPGEAIVAVKEQLRGLPNHGLGYGLLRYAGSPETRDALASQPGPQISFNYLGQFDQVLGASGTGALLGPAPETAGPDRGPENRRPHAIDVAAAVAGHRLGISWTYSRSLYREETVQQLADWYLQALTSLIAHCRSPEAGAYSPSDFPLAELDQKQLDKVLQKVKTLGSKGTQ